MYDKVIFTGGGSGGHVVPALTLMKELRERGIETIFIGGKDGIESELVPREGYSYTAIHTGKLRRYFSFQNMVDILKVFLGIFESFFFLLKHKRKGLLVFSTGGFVSVPVAVSARCLRIPLYIHEQTTRVGLANRIASRFADKVFISFESSKSYFPSGKTFLSGYPVRKEFFQSDREKELIIQGVHLSQREKPLLFITGGGNGSGLLNDKVFEELEELAKKYVIVHQVGKKFIDQYEHLKSDSYIPLAFLGSEMVDLMKSADMIVSRAGAGTVAELMALGKPSIFVPLKIAQKNEQLHNALEAQKKLGSLVVEEDEFREETLVELLGKLEQVKPATEGRPSFSSSGTDFLLREICGS